MRKIAVFILAVASCGILFSNDAHAADLSQFNAGRIIDDGVMMNSSTMSVQQIQNFLNSKLSSCDTSGSINTTYYYDAASGMYGSRFTSTQVTTSRAIQGQRYDTFWRTHPNERNAYNAGWVEGDAAAPYTCLKDYRVGDGRTAAQVIYDAAQKWQINPQVLLVLLQKENSLLTDDYPWPLQMRTATGYGCPDPSGSGGVVCSGQYHGLANQLDWAARLFRKVIDRDPDWYSPYTAGTNYIQWSPNASCGGSNVNVQNWSTASLYDYTPYQPNAAALAAGEGIGDGCSAYGNRNFYIYFSDWFGSTQTTIPYEWRLVSQEAYSDAARTRLFTSTPTTQPGGRIYMRIKIVNMGNQPWSSANVRLGASNARDRASVFRDTNWLSASRLPVFTVDTVRPGETAIFEFSMLAPVTTGSYYEYFTPLIEGAMWFRDIGMYYPINVVSPVPAPNTQRTGLNSGEVLAIEDPILSPDTHSSLIAQRDGNLVMYTNLGKPAWRSNTTGQAKELVMQGDGNLVLYSVSGSAIWNSGTSGNPGARLVLQSDGNLVIYSTSNAALWDAGVTHNPDHLSYVNNTLNTGVVFPGQYLETANRKYKMIFQTDGNLVIYSPSRAIWNSGTFGNLGARLVMQGDGNLVIYSKTGVPLWHTRSSQHGPSYLVLNQNGNAILFNGRTQPTWASNTAEPQ